MVRWPFGEGQHTLTDVSCAATSFCVAVNDDGYAYVFNGTTWSDFTQLTADSPIFAISCPSPSFCMAPDESGVSHTYNGKTWSSQQMPSGGVEAVSCSSSAFCAAFNGRDVMTFDGTSWGPSSQLEATPTGGAISCAAAESCVVVDNDGRAFYTPVP